MITEEQAIRLVRVICKCLAVLGGGAVLSAGIRWLCHPMGNRQRGTARILYFRKGKIGGRTVRFPVVNIGTDTEMQPVTVCTGKSRWMEQPGDLLDISFRPDHPEEVRAFVPGRPWGWGTAVCILGALLVLYFGMLLIPDAKNVWNMLQNGI